MNSIRNRQFLWAVIAALTVLALWGTLQIASAHNIGWKWDNSDDPMVSNIDTPYSDEIESGADDYDDNTDLSVDHCVQPCSESILHIHQNVGSADWAAAADSYSNGQQ